MKNNTEALYEIANTTNSERTADVVFVHGLDGDAYTTWQNGKEGDPDYFFWPEELGKDFQNIGIWSIGYPAGISEFGSAGMIIEKRAGNFALKLAISDLGLHRPLIFICHSMGGLIVKSLVVDSQTQADKDRKKIANSVQGIVFCATPHRGSDYATAATILGKFLGGSQDHVIQMQKDSEKLDILHDGFIEWHRNHQFPVESYAENRGLLGLGLVVNRSSANPNIAGYTLHDVDRNHIDLVKPKDRKDDVYAGVVRFIDSITSLSNDKQHKNNQNLKLTPKSSDPLNALFQWMDNTYIPDYARCIKISNYDDIKKYSDFFHYILRKVNREQNAYTNLEELVGCTKQSKFCNIIELQGDQGAGKSLALSIINSILRYRFEADSHENPLPIFIDASHYVPITSNNERLVPETNRIIESDIDKILNIYKNSEAKTLYLIIDGLNVTDFFWRILLERLCNKLPCDLLVGVIFSTAEGSGSPFFETFEPYFHLPIKAEFKLESLNSSSKDLSNFLKDFIKVFELIQGNEFKLSHNEIERRASFLKRKIDAFKLSSIDIHILAIVYENMNDAIYKDINNLGRFFEIYCMQRLVNTDMEQLNLIGSVAFRLVRNTYAPNKLAINYGDKGPGWKLINEHNNIRDFFAARHILSQFTLFQEESYNEISDSKGSGFFDSQLEFDIPVNVNVFLKSLINKDEITADMVFRTIQKFLEKGGWQTQNYFLYLLGRFEVPALREPSRDLLINIKEKLSNNKSINAYAQIRTVHISLIYLSPKEYLSEYVNYILADSTAASVNRGYHRIYYGDWLNDPRPIIEHNSSANYLLDCGGSWDKSFDYLTAKIYRHLEAVSEHKNTGRNPLFPLMVFTLASFAQDRMLRGSLDDRKKQIIANILDNSIIFEFNNDRLNSFLKGVRLDFDRPGFDKWLFINDLYFLKLSPRQGWLDRSVGTFDKVRRIESVAEHSFFATLLAWFLLPDSLPPDLCPTPYDKQTVLNMLVMHDIAEAYTGDHAKPRLSSNDKTLIQPESVN